MGSASIAARAAATHPIRIAPASRARPIGSGAEALAELGHEVALIGTLPHIQEAARVANSRREEQ
jgi:hypothetical protein